ncbi:MAG: branched-chain amino acid ABC transporter permease [Sedimentisphaerales bacterium]|nr:branched-chain amino acid ABC transporter permease [Sedimentisphaerales bacterium]
MSLSSQILQYLFTGITLGSVYGLVAIGFNIIYNATGIINFAQGEFVMLGGMCAVWLTASVGLPLYVAVPISILIVTAVGVILERVAIRPIRKPDVLSMIIVTIGASIFLKGLVMVVWGKQTFSLPHFSSETPIVIGGAAILPQDLWVLGTMIAIVLALGLFFERTLTGKAIRACAFNRRAASLVGIDVSLMVMISFALSAAVGATAGAVITPKILVSYDRGTMLALKGFSAAVLGGLGNSTGAVLAGLVIGVLESFSAGSPLSHYKDAVALVVLLGVLFIRPSGLLGGAEASRLKKF